MTVALVAVPSLAHAHLVSSGLGPFYDGMLHLVVSPVDLLGVVALSLLAGLVGVRAGRLLVMTLPPTWLVCGLIGLGVAPPSGGGWAYALSLVFLGGLVALDPQLPAEAVAGLAVLYGALAGWLNGSALGAAGAAWSSVLGIAVAVSIVALAIGAAVVAVRAEWMRIAVRVVGSWVAAIGLLMLGWLVKLAG